MRIKTKFANIKWKKGSELIELVITLPILIYLLFAMIGIVRTSLTRQALEEAVSLGARAASVCEDYSSACNQMSAVVRSTMTSGTFGLDPDDIDIQIDLVAGTTGTRGAIRWEKGALICCQASVTLDSFFKLGKSAVMTSQISVMVERPATTYY